jgi:peptidoglycan/LPS O-acetylase OafA/YrhL
MAALPPSPLDRENSCTFLRLFFAFLVVFGHSFVMAGFGEEPLAILTAGALSGRDLGVQCFFALSGFLIAQSLGQNPSLWRFACHRVFRIFPAFWVYLILMVFVVTPLMLEARWPDRFSYGQLLTLGPRPAWDYFVYNWYLQCQEFLIAPLFGGNIARFQVNGSLWSVHYEGVFYLCAAAGAAVWPLGRRVTGLLACLAALTAVLWGSKVLAAIVVVLLWRAFMPRGWGFLALFSLFFAIEVLTTLQPNVLAPLPQSLVSGFQFPFHPTWRISALGFLGGMLCWRYRVWLKWDRRAFLLAVAVLIAGICWHHWRFAMPLALPYVILYLAARLPFQKVERWGDYSYGIYIFAFPIQQWLYDQGLHRHGIAAYLGASLVLSLTAGVLSWWLVEKPALRLGRKLADWDFVSSIRNRRAPLPVAEQLSLPMEGVYPPGPSPTRACES